MRTPLVCLLVLGWAACPAPAPAHSADFAPCAAFLGRHCLHCHAGKARKAGLDLGAYHDEASVLRDRKVWESVLDRVRAGEMPPPKRPRPTPDEVRAFVGSVEALFARADRTARPDPGRVTARRLNRVEYNNTIRDLVGVDFQPAEDFPADEVGHGFDNVGDVLSVSPLHLERYLAAAESIVARAVVVGPPPPPARRPVEAQFLLPPQKGGFREAPFRTLETGDELFTTYRLRVEGDYRLRVRAWGRPAGDEPVRLALRLDGREVCRADVRAVQSKPGDYESPTLHLAAGPHRAAVVLLNPLPSGGDEGKGARRALVVKRLELEGPKDTYPESHRRIMACTPGRPPREQAREILTRLASRAYRRPATAGEVERLLGLVDEAQRRGQKWEAGVALALQAVLVSPKFLFRLEPDDRPGEPGPRPLDDYALASRLSYFLWSSIPDDELFALAGKGILANDLDAQVRRMLADPRADALADNFAMQWLQLGRLRMASPDPRLFPGFNEKLRDAMARETRLFVGAVFREDRSLLELIDADFTFLNGPLARHYGIADTHGNRVGQKPTRPAGEPIRGERFVCVSLGDSGRGGLLTQASVLTATSNPTRTSPVKRGRWVLEQLLGTPPPEPPPGVPPLAEDSHAVLSASLRQRMEQHRANPSCAVCHARMDPLGFAFENFDATGAFRTQDAGFPIDPSGTLPDGRTFRGPDELKKILLEKKDRFARCLAEKMLTYALGRGLTASDRPAIDRIAASMAKDGYRFSALVRAVVHSNPFRLRRGKEEGR
jgi:hypothetical protein